ncbi:hypothetical protein THAOC_35567, partial [Thalassiosira oceanica]
HNTQTMKSSSVATVAVMALSRSAVTAFNFSGQQPKVECSHAVKSRRDALELLALGGATFLSPVVANAEEDNKVLSDEEMEARIKRKMELLAAKKSSGAPTGRATDIRSDVNPDAAVNLRSRSAIENAKIAMDRQKELKNRDKAQKREDLCEMLGRGC